LHRPNASRKPSLVATPAAEPPSHQPTLQLTAHSQVGLGTELAAVLTPGVFNQVSCDRLSTSATTWLGMMQLTGICAAGTFRSTNA